MNAAADTSGLAEIIGDARSLFLAASNLYLALEDVREHHAELLSDAGELLEGLDGLVRKLEAHEIGSAIAVAASATIPSPPPPAPAPDDDECPPTDPAPGASTLDVKDPAEELGSPEWIAKYGLPF